MTGGHNFVCGTWKYFFNHIYVYSKTRDYAWASKCNYRLKGAVRYETFKFIDFKTNGYMKVPVVPFSLMLWSKSYFVICFEKLYFSGKNITNQQQLRCRGVACKPGRQESEIRRAYLPTIHRCVQKYCVSAQQFNTAIIPSVTRQIWGIW